MRPETEISALLREGVDKLNHDRFASAQRVFESILASEASQPVALYLLGVAHFKQSDWVAAEGCLRQALAISPNQPDVCLQLAQTLRALHRPGEAVSLCQKVLLQAPGHIGALVELAKAHQEAEDWEAAEKVFRQLLDIAPATGMAALALGEILCATGRADEAEILLRAALARRRAKDDAETRDGLIFQIAVSLRAQRRYAEALQELESLTSDNMCVRVEKALVLQHLSRFDEAVKTYELMLEKEPSDLSTHVLLNEVFYRRKQDGHFLKSYDHAAARGADPVLMFAAKGTFLLRLNRPDEAKFAFSRALELAPDDPHALSGMARTAEVMNDAARAIALHARNHSRHPENVDATIDYASAMLRQGEVGTASKLVETALRARPYDQGGLALLGLCDRASKNDREFVIHDFDRFVRVFDLDPPPGYSSTAVFNAALAKYLESLHTDKREYFTQTLRGGTRLFGEVFNNGHRMVEQVRPLIEAAISAYIVGLDSSESHPFLARRAPNFRYSGSWSSRLSDSGYHLNHYHSEGWISACYYVAVPAIAADTAARQGWIKFGQPTTDFGPEFSPRLFVQPKPGRLVLFPSYMWHGTEPFSSPQSRTTIAFDIVPRGLPLIRPLQSHGARR
jgi:tetratricopeptide (TPR) repeat protein